MKQTICQSSTDPDASTCTPVNLIRMIRNCSMVPIVVFLQCATVLTNEVAAKESVGSEKGTGISGHWIPLPFYREHSWWLPVDPSKPMRINAEWIAPIGNMCYLVHRGEGNEVLLNQTGDQLLKASKIWQLDGAHFGFFSDGSISSVGVIDSNGKLVVRPTLTTIQLEERYADAVWNQKAGTSIPHVPESHVNKSKYSVELNSQGKVEPRAMSYCWETGLLAVAQEIPGGGKELRIWDIHSRSCVWRQPLDAEAGIAGVSLLANGRIFVSGGMFKWTNVNYLAVYDLPARRQIARHSIRMNQEPGWLRVLPISRGDEYLSLAPAHIQPKDTMGVFRMDSQTGATKTVYETSFQVSSLAILPGEKTLMVGGENGQLGTIHLDSGKLMLLPVNAGAMVSSLASNRSGNHIVVGTANGSLLSFSLDNPQEFRRYSGLKGEVTSAAIIGDGSSTIAARVSGEGASPFLLVDSVDTTKIRCPGVLWDTEKGSVTPLPVGSGLSVIDTRFLALGDHERGSVAIHDLVTGIPAVSLGHRDETDKKPNSTFGRYGPDGVYVPRLHIRAGGESVRLDSEAFDFQSMSHSSNEPQGVAARSEIHDLSLGNLGDKVLSGLDEFGATIFGIGKNDRYGLSNNFSKDVSRLGSGRKPAVLLLRNEPLLNRDDASGSLSPSGKRAVVNFSNRFGTEMRLVDLEGMRLMSQPSAPFP